MGIGEWMDENQTENVGKDILCEVPGCLSASLSMGFALDLAWQS